MSADAITTVCVGQAVVTIFSVGDLSFDLSEALTAPKPPPGSRYAPFFAAPLSIPVQCIHIQLPQTIVLVDAGAYVDEPDSPPSYTPSPSLVDQMAAAGLDPTRVEHILITHTHWDHYNGLTVERNGTWSLQFPKARIYVGQGDWDQTEMQHALADPASLNSRTLGVVKRAGRLSPVGVRRTLAPGVEIIPSPGETPGHLTLRVASDGKTLYCVGDLYHHTVEVEHPEWVVTWADAATIRASRDVQTAAALAEDALLIATHIPGVGRIVRMPEGVAWESV